MNSFLSRRPLKESAVAYRPFQVDHADGLLCWSERGIVKFVYPVLDIEAEVEALRARLPQIELTQTPHEAIFALREYLAGQRQSFDHLAIDLECLVSSEFQRRVLLATQRIPYGCVVTYQQIAEEIESRAFRAVGTALANNPLPFLIPCHRVVGRNSLGGFSSAGGIDYKAQLLLLEQLVLLESRVRSSI